MVYLKQLKTKLQKSWNSGSVLLDEYNEFSAYPRKIPLLQPAKEEIAKTNNMLEAFRKDLSALRVFCENYNIEIIFETKNLYSYGKQHLPVAAIIPNDKNHASAVEHLSDFIAFKAVINLAKNRLPETLEYFLKSWRWTKNNTEAAQKLIASAEWRRNNPYFSCYVRQAQSINVDTKFLESANIQSRFLELLNIVMKPSWCKDHEHLAWPENAGFLSRDTKRIRLRYLDPKDSPFPAGINDIEIYEKDLQIDLFRRIQKIIVIENNTTIESLPEISKLLVIYGKGKGVAPIGLSIFEGWGKDLFYFGDIDVDGFSCLSLARGSAPFIKSLFMDISTFKTYAPKLGVRGAKSRNLHLSGLTTNEKQVVDFLIEKGDEEEINRLEQEKLPFNLVVSALKNL